MDDRVTPADSGETTADDKEAPMDEREWARSRQALAEGFEECRGIIGALGDETRQQIIMALLEAEECGLRVGEITARTHLSRPAVSHHLKILRDAGIIALRRAGTMNFYHIAADDAQWAQLKQLVDRVYELVQQANREGYLQDGDGKAQR